MNMLPPAIALFSKLLKDRGHSISLFDSTDCPDPEEDSINSDKTKELNLNSRPFDPRLLEQSFVEINVFDAFSTKVNSFEPDLIVVSCTEDMFPLGINLINHVAHLKIRNIFGGVFPTFAPDIVISHRNVDMVGVGEGENLLVDLCDKLDRNLDYENIPGLWFKRENGNIVKNAVSGAVNINNNPILDISIFEEGRLYRPMQGKVWKMFPLETHRGCPYKCAYCNSPSQWEFYKEKTNTQHFRKKDPEKIREEIIEFRDKYNVEAFYFWADTFFAYSPKEFDAFIEMYSEFKMPFWCQTRPETVNKKRILELIDVGLFRMGFGVEHGNAEFRKKYLKRDLSNERIVNSMKIMDSIGIPYSVNNILGFPYETRDLTFDTIELNRNFYPDSQNAYSFSPFHGVPLRKIAEEEGYIDKGVIARSLTKPTVLNMPQYTAEQINGMRRCFMLYVKLPKSKWKEVQEAEKLTEKGNKKWLELRDEVKENYLQPQWNSKTKSFEKLAMGDYNHDDLSGMNI